MSIRRMSLGAGYKYLMSSVARGDGAPYAADNLTRYYAESGTPPGRFLGAGLAGLANGAGVEVGTEVTEQHLFRMLGMLQDPVTGEQLGRMPDQVKIDPDGANIRRPVAGFDLTFSVPKSVSAMWALADPETQRAIYNAHEQALQYVIKYAETKVFASRSGKGGVLQEPVRGVVAAAFDHWDSRAGDPQLHTHIAVLNRVQTSEGAWRTLDSRALFKATVTLSTLYNGVLSDYLTTALGVGWEPTTRRHSATPKYEIAGVPASLREEFSQRHQVIESLAADLAKTFTTQHGRQPTGREMLQLRQQATLQTRPHKEHHSLAELTTRWRTRAIPILNNEPTAWVETLKNRNDLPQLTADSLGDAILRDAARVAVHTVGEKRATFTQANMLAETLRQLHGVRFASPDDRLAVAERTTAFALATSLLITPPELTHTPAEFRRPDGTTRFRAVGSELYTTRDLIDAETRLLEAGRSTDGPCADVAAAPAAQALDVSDQDLAVQKILASGRSVDVLVGPAGAGKTTAMSNLRAQWERAFGADTVIGLAPSATAAEVLGKELGISAENTAKWLTETGRNSERMTRVDELRQRMHNSRDLVSRRIHAQRIDRLIADVDRWSMHQNQLIIVDEASLAGTYTLDALAEHARNAGAKLLLVGDWAQLSAVTAGGAFHMLVRDRFDPPELNTVRRFTHEWERNASIGLRTGRADVLADYMQHDRIVGGDRDSALEHLYRAWQTDIDNGLQSIMIASDNETVRTLNGRAQALRIDRGEVSTSGVETGSGTTVCQGDRIVTRRNDRTLASGTAWVKNGDQWVVGKIRRDGSCLVSRVGGGAQVLLPAAYVREHVDLAYATNAHRAQGSTVDTAHAFIAATTQRELLYVMASRGRESNRLYVDTKYDPDIDTLHGPIEERSAVDVLTAVLGREGADRSATETIRSTWDEASSINRLWSEYETIAAAERTKRYNGILDTCGITQSQLDAVKQSDSYGPLLAALRDAEASGLSVDDALPQLVAARSFADAEDVGSILHHRVDRWRASASQGHLGDGTRIVGLLQHAVGVTDPDVQTALDERRALIEQRAHAVVENALERGQPWIRQLGAPPDDVQARSRWTELATTVAAYRERWNVHGRTILGSRGGTAEQEAERQTAQRAVNRALAMHRVETVDSARSVIPDLDREFGVEL